MFLLASRQKPVFLTFSTAPLCFLAAGVPAVSSCRLTTIALPLPPFAPQSRPFLLWLSPMILESPADAQWPGLSLRKCSGRMEGEKREGEAPSLCLSFLVLIAAAVAVAAAASLSLFQPLITFFPFLSSLPLAHEREAAVCTSEAVLLLLGSLAGRPVAEFISSLSDPDAVLERDDSSRQSVSSPPFSPLRKRFISSFLSPLSISVHNQHSSHCQIAREPQSASYSDHV